LGLNFSSSSLTAEVPAISASGIQKEATAAAVAAEAHEQDRKWSQTRLSWNGFRERAAVAPRKMRNFVEKKSDFKFIVMALCLLNGNAGYINGITLFHAMNFPVSHVTGTATSITVQLATGDYVRMWYGIVVVLSFGVGSVVAGLIVPIESFNMNRSYGRLLIAQASSIFAAFWLEQVFPNDPWFLFLCALTCGMQNAMTTRYSGKVIRTTHLTGCLTDMGIIVAHCLRGKTDEVWLLQILSLQFFFYMVGSYVATQIEFVTSYALLLPIAVYAIVGVKHASIVSERHALGFWTALLRKDTTDNPRTSWYRFKPGFNLRTSV
jgi:uncharacterized membrane protein YoaK (UPF0700 family)